MPFPPFFSELPEIDVPFAPDVVTTRAIASPEGLAVFFDIHQNTTLSPHQHGDQWGTVIRGKLHLTMDGTTKTYGPGEDYFIPAGTVHGAEIPAGTQILDVFAEPDRYAVKRD
ncbi:cupin domain-containing protein [Roseovarius aestuariivivens]|uniref:cupin domain-containing protein n=1 Tax=Roseovarius aestuariivivens TaxID=1888910 RepID=UPI00108208AF|nr:cupin domain-containing protein [Roseovarius aestuariivivens]